MVVCVLAPYVGSGWWQTRRADGRQALLDAGALEECDRVVELVPLGAEDGVLGDLAHGFV